MRSRIAVAMTSIMVLVLLLSACGTTAVPAPTTAPAAPATGGASAATQEPPTSQELGRDKDVLIVAIASNVDNLDAQVGSGTGEGYRVRQQMNSGPLIYTVVETNGKQLFSCGATEPNLAESLTLSEDGKTYTFKLLPNLKFPNADPIDAAAINYTFDRMFAESTTSGFIMTLCGVPGREHVKVIDDRTFTITMDPPNSLLLQNMSQQHFSFLNPKQMQAGVTTDDPWALEYAKTNQVADGPFTIGAWTSDQIELVRNENHPHKPFFKKIIFKVIPDAATRLMLLKSGAIDSAVDVPLENIPELQKDPNITVWETPSTNGLHLTMNRKLKPFDDKNVRLAIQYAIPYDTILKEAYDGYGKRFHGPIPDGMATFDPAAQYYDTDIAKAKEYLAKSGYPNGFDTQLYVLAGAPAQEAAAVWVQSGLREIGIKVEIIPLQGADFRNRYQNREAPMALFEWITFANDLYFHTGWLYRHECCNYSSFENQEVYDLMDKFVLTSDIKARNEAATRIQQLIMEDPPYAYIVQPTEFTVTRSDIKGMIGVPCEDFERYFTWSRE